MQEVGDISVLPEGCMSHILSFTSPQDVCSSSLVSSMFKSAADSDVVWEKFLPSDYKDIVSRSASPLSLSDFSSKKELYVRLCTDPILLDGGNKSLSLEKKSGKKCFMIGARELKIDWGDTPQYWQWISQSDSRFEEVAKLVGVWWLLIRGTIDTRMLSPKTTYAAYMVIRFSDEAHGIDPPIEASVEFTGGGGSTSGTRTVYFVQDPPRRIGLIRGRYGRAQRPIFSSVTRPKGQLPRQRGDGWMEIVMGDLYNDQGEDGEVVMTLKEVAGHWKGGLIVQGIELRPKENDI